MLHLYIKQAVQGDQWATTDNEQLHYLSGVLRVRKGDSISLFDPQGNSYLGSISQINKSEIKVHVDSRQAFFLPKFQLTIACAIPKASGMDDIIDSLTQLGVDTIIVMITQRVVVKMADISQKLERWRKIALSAAQQSQRNTLPRISGLLSFDEVLRITAGSDLRLIAALEVQSQMLIEKLKGFNAGQIVVMIGPEGDFTPEEVNRAIGAGFTPVSLGKNVLKVATAAAAAAALIKLPP